MILTETERERESAEQKKKLLTVRGVVRGCEKYLQTVQISSKYRKLEPNS